MRTTLDDKTEKVGITLPILLVKQTESKVVATTSEGLILQFSTPTIAFFALM